LHKCVRPFSERVGVFCQKYSRRLERVITDFGADHAFGQISSKVKEHYGIEVPTSSARIITQKHAHQIFTKDDDPPSCSSKVTPQSIILTETDGSMIPITKQKERPKGSKKFDGRKAKEHYWKEARLTLARPISSITPRFAATLGKPDKVGQQMLAIAEQSGFTERTHVHCLGDGASWIANQVEEQFGLQATYLVDFYHVCEYLAEAAPSCSQSPSKEWIKVQQERLKSGLLEAVLNDLKAHLESEQEKDTEAPVRRCYRYLDNRRHQLDYKGAIAKGLPIGSGEVESAHRYVVQKRLKISGAWWKEINAADMLALRVNRVNRNWDTYWAAKKAA